MKQIRAYSLALLLSTSFTFCNMKDFCLSTGYKPNIIEDYNSSQDRLSTYPYLSGDAFRALAQHVLDRDYSVAKPGTPQITSFDPKDVKDNDIVFVDSEVTPLFFESYHPHIQAQYILITHNQDTSNPGRYKGYLNDEKILAWFTVNPDYQHEKLIGIPIGLSNRHWDFLDYARDGGKSIEAVKAMKLEKNKLLYLNINPYTTSYRKKILHDMRRKGFHNQERIPFKEYLIQLASHQFTLSPRGNGLDCHRTWEALYMGSVPIVESSTLDSIYEKLPVLIIPNFSRINPEDLEQKFSEISKKPFQKEKLYMDYWIKLIKSKKNDKQDICLS